MTSPAARQEGDEMTTETMTTETTIPPIEYGTEPDPGTLYRVRTVEPRWPHVGHYYAGVEVAWVHAGEWVRFAESTYRRLLGVPDGVPMGRDERIAVDTVDEHLTVTQAEALRAHIRRVSPETELVIEPAEFRAPDGGYYVPTTFGGYASDHHRARFADATELDFPVAADYWDVYEHPVVHDAEADLEELVDGMRALIRTIEERAHERNTPGAQWRTRPSAHVDPVPTEDDGLPF